MSNSFKTFLVLSILTFFLFSSGIAEEGMHPNVSLHQVGVQVISRKLLMYNEVMDYDDAGANNKHDPRKKPGHP